MNLSRSRIRLGVVVGCFILLDAASRSAEAGFVFSTAGIGNPTPKSGAEVLAARGLRAGREIESRQLDRQSPLIESITWSVDPVAQRRAVGIRTEPIVSKISAEANQSPSQKVPDFVSSATNPTAIASSEDLEREIRERQLTPGRQNANTSADILETPPSVVLVGLGLVMLTMRSRGGMFRGGQR